MDKRDAVYIDHLRGKLREAEELIQAIRGGRIDALVISGPEEEKIYTLKGADHTYRVLIESMNEGALILSREGTIVYCNRRFAEMIQEPIQHVMGNCMDAFLDPQDHEKFSVLQGRAFEEDSFKAEILLKANHNAWLPAQVSMRPLYLDDMTLLCMVITDLTSHKATEETLKSYSLRLYHQNKELKRRSEQLARLSSELTMAENRERKRMSKILHDGLQQMLASAKLLAGCLAADVEKNEHKQSAGEIESILDESIKVSRSLSMDLSPPILHEGGLATGLEWLKRSMREKYDFEVDLSLECHPELPEDINVMVFEAIRELLFNAVKHAQVSRARLQLERIAPERLRITVSDEGKGFDACHLGRKPDEVCGFGLFSIRERVGWLGGSLDMESSPEKGSCFILQVPLVPKGNKNTVQERIEAGAPEEVPAPGDRLRVLIADDHTLFRDGIYRILSREPDIEVVGQAVNGREAIEMARKLAPHIILMDISMPEINGIEATAVIHREIPEIRIIGLSMYEDLERAKVIRQAGAAAYQNKACAASELLATVRSVYAGTGDDACDDPRIGNAESPSFRTGIGIGT